MWLVEVMYDRTHKLLKNENCKMAMIVLIKMIQNVGRYLIQKHLRDFLSKIMAYDELEEELHATLYRREADGDKKDGAINQLELPDQEGEFEEEGDWITALSSEYESIQAIAQSAKRPRPALMRRTKKKKPHKIRVPPNFKGKGGPRRIPGTCW